MALNITVETSVYKDGIAQEDNDIILTPDQEHAVILIRNWYANKGSSPVWKRCFVLAGAAGTGKSSIIQHIQKSLGISEWETLCCAFTGKASLNLQRKGNRSSTLHSSLYEYHTKPGKQPLFVKKEFIDYKLIIVDESSMISEEMFDDILSFGIPTIFIGDHCQLPPISGKFNLMEKPDYTLTSIMRQAEKSPIIRASQLAMKGMPIPYCNFDGFRKIHQADLEDSDFLWADQIIVGTNSMRNAINNISREIRGIRSTSPVEGERMIVLRNNSKLRICNGQIIYLTSSPCYSETERCYYADWMDELEMTDPLTAAAAGTKELKFKRKDPAKENPHTQMHEYAYLDFGYAISCHKSQGSGWDKIIVFDERFGFDADTRRRWLYTAITRARKEILIVSE